jgi:hypothetical protein
MRVWRQGAGWTEGAPELGDLKECSWCRANQVYDPPYWRCFNATCDLYRPEPLSPELLLRRSRGLSRR